METIIGYASLRLFATTAEKTLKPMYRKWTSSFMCHLMITSFICFTYLEMIIGYASVLLSAANAEKTFGPYVQLKPSYYFMCHPMIYFFIL